MTSPLVLLIGWSALAEPVPTCGPGDARAHIARGHELIEARNERGALAEFRCAYAAGGSAEALAQIALAEMALGRWLEAETDLEGALAHEQDPWIQEKSAELGGQLERIRDNVGELMVDGTPQGAELLVNGRRVGKLPLEKPVRVPTGKIEIQMRAQGFQPAYRERRVEARVIANETIELAPLEQSPRGSDGLVDITADRQPRWPAWVTLGGGLLALGGGITLHLLREQRADDFNTMNACGDDKPDHGGGACVGIYDDVQLYEKLFIAGYATAAVLGATSLYLFLSSGPKAGGATHAFACLPDLVHGGLSCAARF